MRSLASVLVTLSWAFPAWSLVDMRNANYTDTWTFISVPGTSFDLKFEGSINSRTLYSGLLGFGWCTDYETTLTPTAEGHLRLQECGAGMRIEYIPKEATGKTINNTIDTILGEVKKRNATMNSAYLANLRKELSLNANLRDEFSRQLNLKGQIKEGVEYLSNGRSNEKIIFKNKEYVRSMADGTLQKFDDKGMLTHIFDKTGNFLRLNYAKGKLDSVVDNNGRKLTFKFTIDGRRIAEVFGPNSLVVKFEYKGEDMVKYISPKKEIYGFDYDELHNPIKISFPDKTTKALTYNKDKDWVTSFKDRDNCLEKYVYESSKTEPLNHYWSTVEKKCGERVTNRSKYEFFHRERKDGSRFLYRSVVNNNGSMVDVTYHEVFGKPVSILRNAQKTTFDYFDNGMVKTRFEGNQVTRFQYKNVCEKVSEVVSEFYVPRQVASTKDKKPAQNTKEAEKETPKAQMVLARTISTNFSWDDKRCTLASARNSIGQFVRLKYDIRGRINHIEDQAKKIVEIKYEERFGKPAVIHRPGLGTLNVSYSAAGDVDKVDSKDGPTVAIQVANVFNNLLEIISPATTELNL